jgi:hypothetical protein
MANDAMDNLMKAIMRAEKQYGDSHQYRHVFGALREARYAASRVSTNAEYVSPGMLEARESAGKAHVPPAGDERNPNVPDESASNQGSEAASAGDAASAN